jgi:DNA polymerase III alpha subunit (gram-positive type)
MEYVVYVADVETTGLDSRLNDVIELSLHRLSDGQQKTWQLKPLNVNTIEADALRINGHKLEDLLHQTIYGRETYRDRNAVIVEVENWLADDGVPTEKRVLCGQNINFDKDMFEQLWIKCNSKDSLPFGRRIIDTMQIEFFLDWCKGEMAEGYSLKNLTKKYGIVNAKAHTAEADVKATKEVFEKQVEFFRKVLNAQNLIRSV